MRECVHICIRVQIMIICVYRWNTWMQQKIPGCFVMSLQTRTHTQIYRRSRRRKHIHVQINTHTHAHTRTNTHTHMYTHTPCIARHTQTQTWMFSHVFIEPTEVLYKISFNTSWHIQSTGHFEKNTLFGGLFFRKKVLLNNTAYVL